MKHLVVVLFLLTTFNFFAQGHTTNYTEKEVYLKARKHLELLDIEKEATRELRFVLVDLFYQTNVRWKNKVFTRTGFYEDEILIIAENMKVQIPEWCLLTYIGELEKMKTDSKTNYYWADTVEETQTEEFI